MSIHRTARAAHDGTLRRWRPLAAALPAALLLAGGALTARGLLGPGGGPHPQPLPAQVFSIDPAAARTLPGLPTLANPQPGSVQAACARLPGSQPQIAIPSLCIYAPLVPARVAGTTLGIPADVRLAALDAQSAALGARHGTTIIAGHVDNASQGDGVFYFLYQIRPGALITITGPGHAITTWRAYKTAIARKTALPPDIWSLTGPRRLILITCGGPLQHTQAGNTYRDNILIYATSASRSRVRRLCAQGLPPSRGRHRQPDRARQAAKGEGDRSAPRTCSTGQSTRRPTRRPSTGGGATRQGTDTVVLSPARPDSITSCASTMSLKPNTLAGLAW